MSFGIRDAPGIQTPIGNGQFLLETHDQFFSANLCSGLVQEMHCNHFTNLWGNIRKSINRTLHRDETH